ncbi:putative taxadien-5-alpha-ol O-acetyltransferase [Dioscorea sansibarensis]
MNFPVTKLSESFVKPYESTLCDNTLPLSSLDKFPTFRSTLTETLLVFKYGQEPEKIIKVALSKALVHYYPVAGDFSVSDQGELEIACTSRGVWFVEAYADCRLEDFDYLDNPYVIPRHYLIPQPPSVVEDPTSIFFSFQVTKFKCDGFVVGMRSSHLMFDGVGSGQFLKAIGEMARGYNQPSIPPIWCRAEMPIKPQFSHPDNSPLPPPPSSSSALITLQRKFIDIPPHQITKMKNKLINQKCSTFDVLVAKLWRSKLRAIKTNNPDVLVQIAFVVDARRYLSLEGYYGNCLYMKEIEISCGKVVNGSFTEVVELIQNAKRGLASEFSAWVSGGCKAQDTKLSYEKITVNDWTSIRFEDVDYGWGAAMSMILVEDVPAYPCCLFTKTPKLPNGVRLVTSCVTEEHMEEFVKQMNDFDD